MFIHMLPRLQQEGVCEHGEHTALICWPAYDCIDCDQGSDEIKRTPGGGVQNFVCVAVGCPDHDWGLSAKLCIHYVGVMLDAYLAREP